jgi:serine O-acetyltransferase
MSAKKYNPAMPVSSHIIIGLYRIHRLTYLSKNFFIRKVVCKFLSLIDQMMIQAVFHCVLPKEAEIGKNFMMPHPFGVLISPEARIGDNVKIMHHVTIGHNELSDAPVSYIDIGDNVYIAPGALVLSNSMTIGKGAVIGPNVVVMKDVPPGAVLVSMPAYNVGRTTKASA